MNGTYLDVPFYMQKTSFTCGAACLRMILKTILNRNFSERSIARKCRATREFGISWISINIFLNKLQRYLNYELSINASVDMISDYLDKQRVTLVLVEANVLNGHPPGELPGLGHYIIATGNNGEYIKINDPSRLIGCKDRKIYIMMFIDAWDYSERKVVSVWRN